MKLLGKYTLFAEGARGSLTKQLIANYKLCSEGRDPQKFGIGLKELWELPPDKHQRGLVLHTMGWPLDNDTGGGLFMYHWGENFVLHRLRRPSELFEPLSLALRRDPAGQAASRASGNISKAASASAMARARITEGGFQSVPKLAFPGGALIGCAAGFVNLPRIKGSHNAMLTGMMAAEAAFAARGGRPGRRHARRLTRRPIAQAMSTRT